MNKQREDGFYWVLIMVGSDNTKWVVAEYYRGNWHYQGCGYNDINFKVIDERKIQREK